MSPPGSTGSRRRSRSTPCPAVGRGRFLDAWRQGILGAVVEPVHRLPVRSRDQVPVCVHGELDRGVAELGFNARYGLAIDGVTPTAARALAAYPWPGNVRELEAVLREAMVLQGRGWLRAEDLALPAPEGEAAPLTTVPGPPRDRGPPSAHARAGGAPDGVSTSELARAAGVGLTLARAELGALAAAGALRRTGAGRAVRYVRP